MNNFIEILNSEYARDKNLVNKIGLIIDDTSYGITIYVVNHGDIDNQDDLYFLYDNEYEIHETINLPDYLK